MENKEKTSKKDQLKIIKKWFNRLADRAKDQVDTFIASGNVTAEYIGRELEYERDIIRTLKDETDKLELIENGAEGTPTPDIMNSRDHKDFRYDVFILLKDLYSYAYMQSQYTCFLVGIDDGLHVIDRHINYINGVLAELNDIKEKYKDEFKA